MSRFKNDGGGVLTVSDLGRQVGPYEEFDWPGHDPEVHGPVSGCTRLDAPEPGPAAKESGSGDPPPGDDTKAKAKRGSAAGQENQA